MWLKNQCRKKGVNPKMRRKFVRPYEVVEAFSNHTYEIKWQGQVSVQNERHLKLYTPCQEGQGRAPAALEPRRRPNMMGVARGTGRPRGEELV